MDASILSRKPQQEGCSCSLFGEGGDESRRLKNNKIDDVDVELAKEMNELSVKEREKVLDDIHGVAEHNEHPQFIAKCLEEMDLYISRTPKSKRKAYDKAIFIKPSIQNDDEFKLMFIRADEYDGKMAAQRLIKYYEHKLQLFGVEKLAKEITVADLHEDIDVFSPGGVLVLPHKDAVGRPLWFFDITRYNFDRPAAMLRCCWYMVMLSMKDETAQKKGACNIAYCPGNLLSLPAPVPKVSYLMSRIGEVLTNLPMRITSYHFCYNDPRMQWLLSSVRALFGKHIRMRIRTHYGSHIEMQYSLATFGIHCQTLLQNDNVYSVNNEKKDAKMELHKSYIQRRQDIEDREEAARTKEESTSGIIVCPQANDVLVGRGRPYQDYPGNARFARLIENHNDLYHNHSDKFAKTCLTMDMVKRVHDYGGRFLEKTKAGTWKEIEDLVAREKVAISFRSRVSKAVGNNGVGKVKKSSRKTQSYQHPESQSKAKRFRYDTVSVVPSNFDVLACQG